MCGIAATFAYNADAPPVDRDELICVRDHMTHRGPDGEGLWISDDQRVGLAHRRLSIIDLSEAGAEPMWNVERTLCITFNGEIYNYVALRDQLIGKGYRFNSHCDAEVLLQLYADKGEAMMNDLRGMYAFAIWDVRERTLLCARDPFGIKPLYYADDGRTLHVASQVQALFRAGVGKTVDPAAHVGFFLWGSVPDPFTLFREVQGLPAGHSLTVREDGAARLTRFCFIPEIFREAEEDSTRTALPFGKRQARLHHALRDSAEAHLVADVPVGVFLSAGLDSSTLAALISERHDDVRTVTLGFEDFRGTEADETRLAEVVARQYRTRHETIWISRRDFEADARRLFEVMDRPSVDGVNTFFVSLAARRAGLKVALSGVGGDELFGSYPSFRDVPRMVKLFKPLSPYLPSFGREFRIVTAPILKRFTSPKYAGVFEYGGNYPGAYLLRRSLFMPWELPGLLDPDLVREGWQRLNTLSELSTICDGIRSSRARVSALELCWYMRHQLLRDSDWAGMGHSLEIRVPLVDVQMLRAIAPLLVSPDPPTKHDMALSPRERLPLQVLAKPKTGFIVPVRDWLLQSFDPTPGRERGLRGWAREVYSRFINPNEMHRLKMRRTKPRKAIARLAGAERRSDRGASKSEAENPTTNGGRVTDNAQPRLRVLFLASDAYGSLGGIGKFNRDFLSALSDDPRVVEALVLPRVMPLDPEPRPPKVQLVTAALGGKLPYLRALREVAMQLRSAKDARLLIFCAHINLMPAAALAKRLCGGTLHLIIHGIDAWSPIGDPTVRAALRALDGFIAVSRVTKLRFQQWTGLRSDEGMILPNSVDLERFTPGPKPGHLIKRYGLENQRVLMTFGRLASAERYKGFDEVLEVLPELAKEFDNLTYLICGEGPDHERLSQKARLFGCSVVDANAEKLKTETLKSAEQDFSISASQRSSVSGSAPRVVFAGKIAEEEKVDHYRLADVYVMPSHGEGFGIVFLEALACGIPVIGSKADGSRDALRDGLLGTLVDPRDPRDTCSAIAAELSRQRNGAMPVDRRALEYFSVECYQKRVREVIDAIVPAA